MFIKDWQFWIALFGVVTTLSGGVIILWRFTFKWSKKFDLIDFVSRQQGVQSATMASNHTENKAALSDLGEKLQEVREDTIRIKAKMNMR